MSDAPTSRDWRRDGVKVVPASSLDPNTPQTPGMSRAAAINLARVGAEKLWAGTVTIHPNAKTGAHHHGALESIIYVVRGRARMRWGERLEYVADAGPKAGATAFRFDSEGRLSAFYWIDGRFGYTLSAEVERTRLLVLAEEVYRQLSARVEARPGG